MGPTRDPNPPPAGTPRANGNAWFHSDFFGYNYVPVNDPNMMGAGTWDFSLGVEVPEPLACWMLALAAAGFRIRR